MKSRKQKLQWIGLTGGIGSGKTSVSELFKSRGISVVDADEISHRVVKRGSAGLAKVVLAFGPDILTPEGDLNRRKLAEMVFGDREQLSRLESIVHPLVQAEVKRIRDDLVDRGEPVAVYDVPLLFEKKLESQFDQILVVGCDEETQIARITKRSSLSREEALQRIHSQLPLAQKKAQATWYIDNSGTLEDLKKIFDSIFKKIQSGIV